MPRLPHANNTLRVLLRSRPRFSWLRLLLPARPPPAAMDGPLSGDDAVSPSDGACEYVEGLDELICDPMPDQSAAYLESCYSSELAEYRVWLRERGLLEEECFMGFADP